MNANESKRGMALVVVLCLTVLATAALSILATMVGGAMLRTRDLARNEQAFYIAEGAIEVAVQHIADGGTVPATLTGRMAGGEYEVQIQIEGVPAGSYTRFRIESEGTSGARTRRVEIKGVRAVSWARYALWYDDEALQLWMVGGEEFHGPVHANTQFRFHSYLVNERGQTRFHDSASSTESTYNRYSGAVNPVFENGLVLNAPAQSTTSVDFNQLKAAAGLVFQGTTKIELRGTDMIVSNARAGYNNRVVALPANGSVYVATATSGTTTNRAGDVVLSAPQGLNGRLTIVADRDVQIVGHVRYASNPVSNPASTDALGLVANRHIAVQTSAPDDLEIYAHMIAADGGFGVVDYSRSSLGDRGVLTVYGGIVNKTRQAVGTTSGTGYRKNYQYDSRFHTRPPPGYPLLPYTYQWSSWAEG